ncbi:MAG TPA: AlpA family transcriptional regulator [Cellvibrio sp.]|nr:AlpA family transcriptional regulator [Cellvibrio sp.]
MAIPTNQSQNNHRFIKLNKVKEYTSLSTSEVYRRIAAGTFPSQIPIGPKSVVWIESEIQKWCDDLVKNRG